MRKDNPTHGINAGPRGESVWRMKKPGDCRGPLLGFNLSQSMRSEQHLCEDSEKRPHVELLTGREITCTLTIVENVLYSQCYEIAGSAAVDGML